MRVIVSYICNTQNIRACIKSTRQFSSTTQNRPFEKQTTRIRIFLTHFRPKGESPFVRCRSSHIVSDLEVFYLAPEPSLANKEVSPSLNHQLRHQHTAKFCIEDDLLPRPGLLQEEGNTQCPYTYKPAQARPPREAHRVKVTADRACLTPL